MIQVGMFARGQMAGAPLAVLSYSGRGKTVKIATTDSATKQVAEALVNTILGLPANSAAYPETRQYWMESLPKANHTIPYWFKILDEQSSLEEDDTNDNEEIIEEDTSDGGTEDGGTEDGGDDNGGDSDGDGGGDEDGGDGFSING